MKAKGKNFLYGAGVLEVVMGVSTIGLTIALLSVDPSDYVDVNMINLNDALGSLVLIYVIAGIQIIAGIVAIAFKNKPNKANVCKFFGVLLVLVHVVTLKAGGVLNDDYTRIIQYVSLLVPLIYLVGAIQNGKSTNK